MIREFTAGDFIHAFELHEASGLDRRCFPKLYLQVGEKVESNALFIEKAQMEVDGEPVMSCFLKVTSEVYILVDHTKGTPEERFEWLKEMREYMEKKAREHGLSDVTCWVPPEIDKSFGKRLEDLGFVRSPWQSYTLVLE